ncbi:MAG: hypothetical protein NC039_03875 [Muribaculaceae bacterium]|nr:hypothetical protein [Muribaculaceae bacterium]
MDKKTAKCGGADYRGADINKGDDCKNTKRLVKEDIKDLNNNPRNNEIDN